MRLSLTIFISCLFLHASIAQKTISKDQPEELGQVKWLRDYDEAAKLAKAQGKAILILFQEVPGCATCRNYGQNVLSHPLMVEAIENEFVPLAIYNNKGGKDKEVLERYGEPTWNNPVVRIVNADGKNLVSRVAGNYSARGLYDAMEKALKEQGKSLPQYFILLGDELSATEGQYIKEKDFNMYCFWTGEKVLGAVDGVLTTEAGFAAGGEAVKVTYDSRKVSEKDLVEYAGKSKCSPAPGNSAYRPAAKDHLYYLRQTDFRYLPLTDMQKTKINSALGNRRSGTEYLSPRQTGWLQQVRDSKAKKEVLFEKDFAKAWEMKEG